MNRIIKSIFLFGIISFVSACKKDEGNLPNISFKTTTGYVSADATKVGGSVVTIGIDASKAEDADYLKKFNISKSVNGAAETTVFDKDLTGTEGDAYTYDYVATMDTTHGQTNKYTFTVTNRDGLVNKVALTLTVQ
jgi:hypothetical protein